ncbi:hypothetical protein Tco_0670041 [Tanacetum coccineum]
MEKRSSALEFKTSGKYLRALKQILETMQTTRRVLENKEQSLDSQKSDQSGKRSFSKDYRCSTMFHLPNPPGRTGMEKPVSSPRLQRSKNGINKHVFSQSNPKCSLLYQK